MLTRARAYSFWRRAGRDDGDATDSAPLATALASDPQRVSMLLRLIFSPLKQQRWSVT